MECHVCLEAFDAVERRPKSLPCGHTYCLRCLQRLRVKRCPVDNKVFESSPNELADNFMVLQLSARHAEPVAIHLWCRTCDKVAAESCVDSKHEVCTLKKARALDAAPLLEALQQGEAGLDAVRNGLDAAARGLHVEACRTQLQREKDVLVAARGRLQDAMGADAAVWKEAKQAAEQAVPTGWSRSGTQLAADLADPTATCSLTVRRGAAGAVAWLGEVRLAEDAAARLMLYRLACRGGLQHQDQPKVAQRPAASHWQERPNEVVGKLTLADMAARMVVGSRVARGKDWPQGCTVDGNPPGPGTVTSKGNGTVNVKWDRTGSTRIHCMGSSGQFEILLLSPGALRPPIAARHQQCLDVGATRSSKDFEKMSAVLTDGRLAEVRGLVGVPCSAAPAWSLKALQQVAPHLQGLQLVSPQPELLKVALAMPQLQTLELHCKMDAPLPVQAPPAMRLQWLRCGVYPLAAALALVRANADSLEELQLVAASDQPYGCPDLAAQLKSCGLKKLRRVVLLRQTAYEVLCRHNQTSCAAQKVALFDVLVDSGCPSIMCTDCDVSEFRKLTY